MLSTYFVISLDLRKLCSNNADLPSTLHQHPLLLTLLTSFFFNTISALPLSEIPDFIWISPVSPLPSPLWSRVWLGTAWLSAAIHYQPSLVCGLPFLCHFGSLENNSQLSGRMFPVWVLPVLFSEWDRVERLWKRIPQDWEHPHYLWGRTFWWEPGGKGMEEGNCAFGCLPSHLLASPRVLFLEYSFAVIRTGFSRFQMCTGDQLFSRDPPGLQHQSGDAETYSLVDQAVTRLDFSSGRQPLLDYPDCILLAF